MIRAAAAAVHSLLQPRKRAMCLFSMLQRPFGTCWLRFRALICVPAGLYLKSPLYVNQRGSSVFSGTFTFNRTRLINPELYVRENK